MGKGGEHHEMAQGSHIFSVSGEICCWSSHRRLIDPTENHNQFGAIHRSSTQWHKGFHQAWVSHGKSEVFEPSSTPAPADVSCWPHGVPAAAQPIDFQS